MDREDSEEYQGRMGELPGPLLDERGEAFRKAPRNPSTVPGAPGGFPATPDGSQPAPVPFPPYQGDIAAQSALDQGSGQIPLFSPPREFDVTVTYPAQPINSIALSQEAVTYLSTADDPVITLNTAQFVVPEGFIAVVRRIRWFPTNLLIINAASPAAPDDFTSDAFHTVFTRNGSLVGIPRYNVTGNAPGTGTGADFYTPVDFYREQIGDKKTYILGNPGDVIAARFNTGFDYAGGFTGYTTLINVTFEGELLVTQGRELPFEPSNRN